jgi:ABC-type transporter Mla maintaining outer membrane lipid asymmetry ATPase subunit MlaF
MIQKNIVEIKNLSFGYDNRMLHKDINMVFPRGKVTAIMGGSGCGKTTILRLIGGQIKPKAGQVSVDGKIVHKQDRQGEEKWACFSSMAHFLQTCLYLTMWHFQFVNIQNYLKA